MGGDAGHLNAACGQFHHDQHVVRHQAMLGGHLDREEIGRGEPLPVEFQELLPAHARLAALRSGLQVVAAQDILHRDGVAGMPQVCECPWIRR
jgi:hypothetical protein